MYNYFNDRMFNQQYINPTYFGTIQPLSPEQIQDQKVCKAVNAMHDLCEAVNGMDEVHQKQAFLACLTEMAMQLGW